MRKIKVFIEDLQARSFRTIEIPIDIPVALIIPVLIGELQFPKTDIFGEELQYVLRDANSNQIFPENSTLQAFNILPGTQLKLDSSVTFHDNPTVAIQTVNSNPLAGNPNSPENTLATTIPVNANGAENTLVRTTPAIQIQVHQKKIMSRRAILIGGGSIAVLGIGYTAYAAITKNRPNLNQTQKTPPLKATTTQKTNPIPTTLTTIFSFTQHQQAVRCVVWAPNGTLLASGGDDRKLFVWSTDGNIHLNINNASAVHAIAWSPENERLATASGNKVTFLNALNGNTLAHSGHKHTAQVKSLAWTPQNQHQIVSGSEDTHAIVWNSTDFHVDAIFTHHHAAIESVSWAQDGQTIASCTQTGVIRVWKAVNPNDSHLPYQVPKTQLNALAFAPTGSQLAVGANDGIIRIWNGLVCQRQQGNFCIDTPIQLKPSRSAVRALAWSPDNRFLATGDNNGTLLIWNPLKNENPLVSQNLNTTIHSITWAPNSMQIAVAAGNIITLFELR